MPIALPLLKRRINPSTFHRIKQSLSAEDYALLNAFADVIVRDDNPISRTPQGKGWVQGGSGKGKSGAMKVALQLANKLEKQRDFEIHVEYADDGSFTVWYRYV